MLGIVGHVHNAQSGRVPPLPAQGGPHTLPIVAAPPSAQPGVTTYPARRVVQPAGTCANLLLRVSVAKAFPGLFFKETNYTATSHFNDDITWDLEHLLKQSSERSKAWTERHTARARQGDPLVLSVYLLKYRWHNAKAQIPAVNQYLRKHQEWCTHARHVVKTKWSHLF